MLCGGALIGSFLGVVVVSRVMDDLSSLWVEVLPEVRTGVITERTFEEIARRIQDLEDRVARLENPQSLNVVAYHFD